MWRALPMVLISGLLLTLGTGCARLGNAAKQSAQSPRTWAPLVGAGLLAFDDMDDKISKWGYRENPIFNNTDNADDWSDIGQSVTWDTSQLTLLLVDEPWGERVQDWAVMIGAREVTSTVTGRIKRTVGRERPIYEESKSSFPSGHTSKTAAASAMGRANLKRAGYEKWAPFYDVTLFITGWSRVEAGRHYPSDVLVGWALGNFFGQTAALAFFDDPTVSVDVDISREVNYLGFSKRF